MRTSQRLVQPTKCCLWQPLSPAASSSCSAVRSFSTVAENFHFAVRGEIDVKVARLKRELDSGIAKPFPSLILGHLSNPQAAGRQPITFFRQVMALCNLPAAVGVDSPEALAVMPADVIARARDVLKACGPAGTGAYTHSQGMPGIREEIARFLEARDGHPADGEEVFLVNSTSDGVHLVLTMLVDNKTDVVLCPAPGYPGWESIVRVLGATVVHFPLQHGTWTLDLKALEGSIATARSDGKRIRALVLTNPSNPSGHVMSASDLAGLGRLCAKEDIALLADEVYQEQVYLPDRQFVSAKKAILDAGITGLRLFSFHSASKGSWGEGSRRGGFVEMHGLDPHAHAQFYKLKSAGLCAGVTGQIALSLLAKPPAAGDASYDLFVAQRQSNLQTAAKAAAALAQELDKIDGIECPRIEGGDFAFAKLVLPAIVHQQAKAQGIAADALYTDSLLENAGVSALPASAFTAPADWCGFRIAIPSDTVIPDVVQRIAAHHSQFVRSLSK